MSAKKKARVRVGVPKPTREIDDPEEGLRHIAHYCRNECQLKPRNRRCKNAECALWPHSPYSK